MIEAICKSWWDFKRVCDMHAKRDPLERRLFWFRGQSDARWPLQATLDREYRFKSDKHRETFSSALLQEFRLQATGLGHDFADGEDDALELLARHHGLPSPILDWTESPYIAAYFAFLDAQRVKSRKVAIWAWSRDLYYRFGDILGLGRSIDPIDDPSLLRYNPRAVQQQSVFMRLNTRAEVPYVTRYLLPSSGAAHVLADLGSMNITARNLFRDLEGAVKTAMTKVRP